MTIMKTATLTKPRATNLTVKLESSDRDRLTSIASFKQRSPHFIMKEAIQRYLDIEEVEQHQISLADASIEQYEKTGLHVTLNEMRDWMRDKKLNPNTPRPLCHA
jgi:predicted transcriptional regulator